jgi:flagellar biosynthesis protein FlhB
MPDSAQEKTETPTPRRREEAREQGQVAKSQDLSAALILFGGLLLLYFTGQQMFSRLIAITRSCLNPGEELINTGNMGTAIMTVMREVLFILLPLLILVLVLAILGSLLQVGFLFTFKPMQPSLDKINPLSGLKRMFSGKSFMQLVMGIAKMGTLSLVAYITIRGRLDALVFAPSLGHLAFLAFAAHLCFDLGMRLAAVLLVLALLDFAYQRYRHEKDLRMTKEEVKEEMKRMEGDPKVKQQRRQIQMQMSVQRIQAAVPQADVVVTNPTRLAVVIRYNAETMEAPKVTAKGAGYLAQRIRELAIEHNIPIVERKPLAQALYKTVEVGQEIPSQFYKAVAEILAYVYELSGRRHYRRTPASASLN